MALQVFLGGGLDRATHAGSVGMGLPGTGASLILCQAQLITFLAPAEERAGARLSIPVPTGIALREGARRLEITSESKGERTEERVRSYAGANPSPSRHGLARPS